MLRKRSGAIEWLEFDLFQEIPGFVHGVFLRHGGFSTGEFSSLNVGSFQGDDPLVIQKNLEAIRGLLGVSRLITSEQKHSSSVQFVTNNDSQIPPCDGLVTKETNLALLMNHADCQVAILIDPIKRALATIHAGWRGNVQNIYKEGIDRMRQAGCLPENILVGISPSLGPEASQFINFRTEFPEPFWQFQFKPDYFNLWELARFQLLECGILSHHLEIASICTYTNPADFFSYRRVKKSGRHGTAAAFLF